MDLPSDCWAIIMRQLDGRTLAALNLTNQTLHETLISKYIWTQELLEYGLIGNCDLVNYLANDNPVHIISDKLDDTKWNKRIRDFQGQQYGYVKSTTVYKIPGIIVCHHIYARQKYHRIAEQVEHEEHNQAIAKKIINDHLSNIFVTELVGTDHGDVPLSDVITYFSTIYRTLNTMKIFGRENFESWRLNLYPITKKLDGIIEHIIDNDDISQAETLVKYMNHVAVLECIRWSTTIQCTMCLTDYVYKVFRERGLNLFNNRYYQNVRDQHTCNSIMDSPNSPNIHKCDKYKTDNITNNDKPTSPYISEDSMFNTLLQKEEINDLDGYVEMYENRISTVAQFVPTQTIYQDNNPNKLFSDYKIGYNTNCVDITFLGRMDIDEDTLCETLKNRSEDNSFF